MENPRFTEIGPHQLPPDEVEALDRLARDLSGRLGGEWALTAWRRDMARPEPESLLRDEVILVHKAVTPGGRTVDLLGDRAPRGVRVEVIDSPYRSRVSLTLVGHEACGHAWTVPLPDGRALFVDEMAYEGRLGVGPAEAHWLTDEWRYPSVTAAVTAGMRWYVEQGAAVGTEPDGWTRHVGSGRRRPDGTKESEVVQE